MNVLLSSPLGALLAQPWVDPVGLFGAERWYLPLSRLWAAANAAGEDATLFRDNIGAPLPDLPPAGRLRGVLGRHARMRLQADAARRDWEGAVFVAAGGGCDAAGLDRQRRRSATRHLSTRAWFYPLLFGRRFPPARWRIDAPDEIDRALGPVLADPARLYGASIGVGKVEVSQPCEANGRREYWLRAPTPLARLRQRAGSERAYARIVEPAAGADRTLIFGSGLCLETDLLSAPLDSAGHLASMGWRVIEPVSPYHGLRAGADQFAGSHRRPGRRSGVAHRLEPPPVRGQGGDRRHLLDLVRGPAGGEPLPSVGGRSAS
jgi:hypothetical protein